MKRNTPENRAKNTPERRKAVFLKKISRKAQRKLNAQKSNTQVWLGMRMFGLVGWAVSVPTLIGIAMGVWLDRRSPGQYSWTLMLLLVGLTLGCFNAWYWLDKEGRGR